MEKQETAGSETYMVVMGEFINDGQPFHTRDIARLGLNRHDLRSAIRSHRLCKVFYAVYVDSHVPDSRWLRVTAAELVAPPHAIICDEFASWLHGVDTFRPTDRHTLVPKMVVPHGTHRVTTAGVSCRHAKLPKPDVMEMSGMLVTTPVRTASDLLRSLWRPYALAAADGMAHAGLIDSEQVGAYLDRLRGYPGVVQGRELAPLIEPGAASPGESWQRLRIVDAGFPRPVIQFHLQDRLGFDRCLDLAYPELLIAIEYDGREFHTAEADRAHDAERRGGLEEAQGWRFFVSRREDIFGRDDRFERDLGKLLGRVPLPRNW